MNENRLVLQFRHSKRLLFKYIWHSVEIQFRYWFMSFLIWNQSGNYWHITSISYLSIKSIKYENIYTYYIYGIKYNIFSVRIIINRVLTAFCQLLFIFAWKLFCFNIFGMALFTGLVDTFNLGKNEILIKLSAKFGIWRKKVICLKLTNFQKK